ncbi:MAG: putative zinc-binding metallopeptidase [Acidobacteriota bacterium]|nr:putative zinc-binding metallopeptidase [Acidobacteriota bacterium]MDH3784239.1 putative zinc-binding metallopeptidase [Acidobacteriota bacterium]
MARRRRDWTHYDDESLLDERLCDLDLTLEGTPLERRVQRLYAELDRRGIGFRPHAWLSSEWFSPDGVPGVAIPFFLAHPRLMKLELRQMLEVEGGSSTACMRLLRHETGHAIDTAYRLHRRKRWRDVFGLYSQPYPRIYRPRPSSRAFVLHLDAWYAQAHPAEDFAETFAVWLTPRLNWRKQYADWPKALAKLQFVDELMKEEVLGKPAPVRSKAHLEPVSKLRMTLKNYYRSKRSRYGLAWPDVYDRDLKRLFSDDPRHARRPPASTFLRRLRPKIRGIIAEYTNSNVYTVDQVLQDMIERCRVLKLRLTMVPSRTETQAIVLVTVHTMSCLHARRFEIPV